MSREISIIPDEVLFNEIYFYRELCGAADGEKWGLSTNMIRSERYLFFVNFKSIDPPGNRE
jgi:hypothetical protein